MSLIRVSESDNWIVDYETESKTYRVSYFEDGHFVDQCKFDEYKEQLLFHADGLSSVVNKVNLDILSGKGLSKL